MVDTADAIIIGAGIMGVSTAYHLAQRKYGKVVVLERDTVCSGATGLASGLIRHQFSARVGVELSKRSMATFSHFEEEFGVDVPFHRCGYLWLAQTEEELALFKDNVAMQQSLGVDVLLLDRGEIKQLCPYLNVDDVLGASYSPRDGYADPYLCTTAMAQRARDLGVAIRQQHEVVDIKRSSSGISAVRTEKGTFEAPVVVIAAGPWAAMVGGLAQADIPVSPARRESAITAPFSDDKLPANMPHVREHRTGFSFRREGPGILFGYNPRDRQSTFNTASDWSLIPDVAQRAIHRCPVLEDAQILRTFAGLLEVTPDRNGIIDAVPGIDGLYVIGGFSGHGFMHAPIAGQLMAELIVDGQARTVDISALNIERFSRGVLEMEAMTTLV